MNTASDSAPSITLDTLAQHAQGLVGFSGCLNGVVPQRVEDVHDLALAARQLFGAFRGHGLVPPDSSVACCYVRNILLRS